MIQTAPFIMIRSLLFRLALSCVEPWQAYLKADFLESGIRPLVREEFLEAKKCFIKYV